MSDSKKDDADETPASADRFSAEPSVGNHFAWLRTRLGLERTLLAWERTGLSLIGFGFTIVQFFERLHDMDHVAAAARPHAPRILGLALIGAGIVAVSVAVFQYWRLNKYLWSKPFSRIAGVEDHPADTPAPWIAILIGLIGVFAFGAVYLRML